mmetsp:Transcript_21020/g.30350  ORF Transcript_21020/g.30350 Transcript_21020/m.30350 type:complete len:204 (+) Transcript_21020:4468-5079(+)
MLSSVDRLDLSFLRLGDRFFFFFGLFAGDGGKSPVLVGAVDLPGVGVSGVSPLPDSSLFSIASSWFCWAALREANRDAKATTDGSPVFSVVLLTEDGWWCTESSRLSLIKAFCDLVEWLYSERNASNSRALLPPSLSTSDIETLLRNGAGTATGGVVACTLLLTTRISLAGGVVIGLVAGTLLTGVVLFTGRVPHDPVERPPD